MKKLQLFVTFFLIQIPFSGLFAQIAFINYTDADGLLSNTVMGVAVDPSNHVWFATQDGVSVFNGTTWTSYTAADGLADNYVTCIAAAPNGDVWAGTDYGVSKFNGTSWTNLNVQSGLVDDMVKYIAIETGGTVWIGTSGGVSKYSGSAFTNYTTSGGLPSPLVGYIYIDDANVKWFCTWMGGVVRFDDVSMMVFDTSDSLLDNNITSMAIDTLGNKYIGTYYGISVLDAQNHWIKNITVADGLLQEVVQDIKIDSKGNIYIGIFVDYLQEGGISVISGNNFYNYHVADGLISAYVDRMAIDQQDNVWIATGNGVSEFLGQYLKVPQNYDHNPMVAVPNPVTHFIRITLDDSQEALCRVYNMNGSLVREQQIYGGEARIDAIEWAKGVYVLHLVQGNQTLTRKIVKQ